MDIRHYRTCIPLYISPSGHRDISANNIIHLFVIIARKNQPMRETPTDIFYPSSITLFIVSFLMRVEKKYIISSYEIMKTGSAMQNALTSKL